MSVTESLECAESLVSALGLDDSFQPQEPRTIGDTGLSDALVEELILKYLSGVGSQSGRGIADHLCLPLAVLEDRFVAMRNRQEISPTGAAMFGDHVYRLTDMGRDRAHRALRESAYVGPAPVPLDDYIASVNAQTIAGEKPRKPKLKKAFSDIHVEAEMLEQLGPAINAGKGMFIYGPPGNGKTTIAQRITRCFGQTILIPHAIAEDGRIIKLYDASCHQIVRSSTESLLRAAEFDRRWVRIQRPTVVVGGELTMENLELKHDPVSNVSEASLQLKSNCGCLLIDDFGRQRINPTELLNRWIIPLENRIDFLTMSNGKKIQVPFEQLIIFSTNLEPHDLADDAFLRRIPFKIEIGAPSIEEFHLLFQIFAEKRGLECPREMVDYLIETHYRACPRPLRRCHARDLLDQIIHYCDYNDLPAVVTPRYLDHAVKNYFTAMKGE
jgi:predicted ATPase with chaperone activity